MAGGNEVFVSAVSIWEIAIKRSIGRGGAPPFTASETVRFCEDAGYDILDMTAAHGAAVEALPLLHKDPFDRMIVAQAFAEPLILLTHDTNVAQYGDQIVRV